MKLNKIEKIIVVIIVLGLILGLGIFMFVKPSFDDIGKQQKVLDSYKQELADLNAKLARLDTIDADIQTEKDTAMKYEKYFYPDMTTYEASELAMGLLKAANFEAHAISISPLATRGLGLQYFLPAEVQYELKTDGQAAKDTTDEEILEIGQFKDGNKTYTITVSAVCDVVITDENGEEVPVNRYTDTMKKVYKAGVCKFAATNGIGQTTGVVQASYQIKGTYADYIKFIDHVYSMERATTFPSVVIPVTVNPKKAEEEESGAIGYIDESGNIYTQSEPSDNEGVKDIPVTDDYEIDMPITLIFLTIEPMDALKTIDADGTTIVVDQRPAVY